MVENCATKVSGHLWDFKQNYVLWILKLKCKILLIKDKCQYYWESSPYFIKIIIVVGIWHVLYFDVSGKDLTSNFSIYSYLFI